MMTGISATYATTAFSIAEPSASKPTVAPAASRSPEDTVTISAAARRLASAALDADHDGDSH
ncbi:MAG: hypothetical protein ABSF23_15905 [Terracidiphilus sp.]|jgi:hypothetical protein